MHSYQYSRAPSRRKTKEFVPFTLRTITLLVFAVLPFLCIGGIEYIIRSKALKEYGVSGSLLRKRQEPGTGTGETPPLPPDDTVPTITVSSVLPTDFVTIPTPGAAPPENFVPDIEFLVPTPTIESSVAPTDFVPIVEFAATRDDHIMVTRPDFVPTIEFAATPEAPPVAAAPSPGRTSFTVEAQPGAFSISTTAMYAPTPVVLTTQTTFLSTGVDSQVIPVTVVVTATPIGDGAPNPADFVDDVSAPNPADFVNDVAVSGSSLIYKIPPEFLGQFLLTTCAVILSLLWRSIDIDMKRMEPWYRLSSSTGMTGRELMSSNPLFINSYVSPIVSIMKLHWLPALSAFIYSPMLSLIQFLASTTVFVAAEGACAADDGDSNCRAIVAIRTPIGRALQGVLALTGCAVLVLAALQWSRHSMLRGEPWSIAGMGMLLTETETVGVLAGIDAGCGEEMLRERIKDTRWRLVESVYPDASTKVVMEATAVHNGWTTEAKISAEMDGRGGKPRVVRPLMLRGFTLAAFGVVVLGVLVVVLLYRYTRLTGFEQFMSGQSVGVKMFALALGLVLRSMWEPVEREVRCFEPYRLLCKRHQRPEITLCVDYSRDLPLYTELCAMFNGHFFVAFVGLVGLSVEVLVVLLVGVPFSGSTTYRTYNICTYGSAAILALMLVTLVCIFLRRKDEKMPRLPYYIPVVASYLYAARMGSDFDGFAVEGLGTWGRRTMLKDGGKTYGFGWTVGVDGRMRPGVDEEELAYDYPYGTDT